MKKDKVTVKNQLIKEKQDLDEKLAKLTVFINGVDFVSLSHDQASGMQRQLEGMHTYSRALRTRIIDITSQESE